MANIELKDLLPGKTYSIQVRSKNSNGELSEWSTTHTFIAPKDTSVTLANVYQSQIGEGNGSSTSGILKSSTFNGSLNSDFSIQTDLITGKIDPLYAGDTGWAIDYKGNSIFSNALIRGTLQAGTVTIGKNAYDTHPGLKIDSNNYWYLNASSQGIFSLGGANGITYDGATVTIGDDVNILGGLTTTSLTVGTSPDQVKIANNVEGTNDGIYITKTGDYWYSDASFRLGGSNGISYTGTGNIAIGTGATFAGSIAVGSGNSIFKADSSGIYLGNSVFSSAPFRVSTAGLLIAENAEITGTINATSGSFTGSITSTSGTIGGFTIGNTSLTAGSGSNAVGLNTTGYPFYAGNATPASAPFRVTNSGVLNASGAIISGAITATSGSFTGQVSIASGGSLVAGDTNSGVIINNSGLFGYDGGLQVFSIPTSAGATPSIANFKLIDTAIYSDGQNANLIVGDLSTDNITIRGQYDSGSGVLPAIFTKISGTATTDSTGNGFYIDRAGKFRLAGTNGSITMDGSGNLTATGTIKAKSGYIGGESSGWLIESDRLTNTNVGIIASQTGTRYNFITNPSFEGDITYWYFSINGSKVTPVQVRDPSGTPLIEEDLYAGSYYAKMPATHDGGNFLAYFTAEKFAPASTGPGIRVDQSNSYTFSFYVKTPSGGTVRNSYAAIKWLDATGTAVGADSISSASSTISGEWKRVNVTGAVPVGATVAIPYIKIDSLAANEQHYIDATLFERGTSAQSFFDGNLRGGATRWVGSENSSMSIYSEYAIYSGPGALYTNRNSAAFGITYDGYLNAVGGKIAGWNINTNEQSSSIIKESTTNTYVQYIELNTTQSIYSAPRISVVSWNPLLVHNVTQAEMTTANIITYYTQQEVEINVGDIVSISGFTNSYYNNSFVAVLSINKDQNTFTTSSSQSSIITETSSSAVATMVSVKRLNAQYASDHTPFYASIDGQVSIGSALSYDSEAGLSVTGEIQGTRGYLGGPDGWKYDLGGKLYTGSADSYMAFIGQSEPYAGGISTINVPRVIVDDQVEEYGSLWSNYYAEIDLSTITPGVASDYINGVRSFDSLSMTFNNSPITQLNGKHINVQAVYDQRAFFYQNGQRERISGVSYASGSTTIQFQGYTGGLHISGFLPTGGGTLTYPGLSYLIGAVVSGTGIQSGSKVVSYDEATGRATLDKTTTSSSSSSELAFYTVYATKKATTTIKVDRISQTGTALKLYFKSSVFDPTTVGVNKEYRISTDSTLTNKLKIRASGSTSLVNSLNLQELTVSAIGLWDSTAYDATSNATYDFSTITLTATSNEIPLTLLSQATVTIEIPNSTNRKTLVFYPEDVGVSPHNIAGAENGYIPTSHTLSFNDPTITGTDDYYLWIANESPSSAPFSIKKDNSNILSPKLTLTADKLNGMGSVPVGTIVMHTGSSLPSGWLLCDGQSTTGYTELAAVVGSTVPDLRGRFPLGASGPTGRLNKTVGTSSDIYTHSHTVAVGSHRHGVTDGSDAANTVVSTSTASGGSHNHADNFGATVSGSVSAGTYGSSALAAYGNTSSRMSTYTHGHGDNFSVTINGSVSNDASHAHTISTAVAGVTNNTDVGTKTTSSPEHVPPYYAVNFIIYAGR